MFTEENSRKAHDRRPAPLMMVALSLALLFMVAASQAQAGLVVRADFGPVTVRLGSGHGGMLPHGGGWVVVKDQSCCESARHYGGQVVVVSERHRRHHQHMTWVPGHYTAKRHGCRNWVPGHWRRF